MLTHFDASGNAHMVGVSGKPDTRRVAVAEAYVTLRPETLNLVIEGKAAKGDVWAWRVSRGSWPQNALRT